MCLVWYALVSKEYKRREIPATDDPEQPEILPPYGVLTKIEGCLEYRTVVKQTSLLGVTRIGNTLATKYNLPLVIAVKFLFERLDFCATWCLFARVLSVALVVLRPLVSGLVFTDTLTDTSPFESLSFVL